jgi:hypothetical protein
MIKYFLLILLIARFSLAQISGGTQDVNILSGNVTLTGSNSVSVTSLPGVSLNAGSNTIGAISNTGFGITGTLPAFASTPTFNIGTISGIATETTLSALNNKTPALGQATMANSQPVAIASNQSALPVTGTFFQATQPVSLTALPSLATGSNVIGSISNTSFTANAGTNLNTSALNLETTQTALNNKVPTGLTVKAASTAAVATDQALVVAISPNNSLSTTISGTPNVNVSNSSIAVNQSGTWNVGLSAGSNAIGSITNTGFNVNNFPATQAVTQSGTWSVNLGTGAFVDRTTAAAPYSFRLSDGTSFYDARQIRALTAADVVSINGTVPVSLSTSPLPVGAATETTLSLFSGKFASSAALADGTANPVATAIGSYNMAYNGTTWDRVRASAKGVQATTALAVQNLKDSGRDLKVYSATFTATTAEALLTVTPITNGTAGGTATSFGVTAGKRLRLQQICVSTRNAAAAGQGVVIQLRMTSTGAIAVGSPLVGTIATGSNLAIANSANSDCMVMPDGFELSGTQQFGLTQVGTATANNTVVVTGYEY